MLLRGSVEIMDVSCELKV